MKIVAHRGGSAGTPENTLAAFANAVAIGADIIELDIHLSKDGVPVVIHDATLDRTTDGTGLVNSYTVQELKQFDAGQGGGFRGWRRCSCLLAIACRLCSS